MDFVNLHKLVCPEGHSNLSVVSQKNDCYILHCADCGVSYYEHDCKRLPVDRSGFKPLDPPSVYGKPN